jgi:large subunit ribosomal protein L4
METKLLSLNGKEVGKYELPEFLFNVKPDLYFLHEAVKYYLANKHRGTASTKTRGEISGGGRKPWKQKGSGRARSGSNRSPVWRKGGIVFGPRPHSYRQDMSETKRRSALIDALSAKQASGGVFVLESLDLKDTKTKALAEFYKNMALDGKRILFVMDKPEKNFLKASRNIPRAGWSLSANLNAYEVLRHGFLIFTVSGMAALIDKLKAGGGKEGK